MTYPAPQPNPHPSGPHGPREFSTGAALYTGQPHTDSHPRCQQCSAPAEIHDIDGSWCSDECQRNDRVSEYRQWRKELAL